MRGCIVRDNYVQPKGFSQAKLPVLRELVERYRNRWKTAVVIGAEHIQAFMRVPELYVIDSDFRKLHLLRKTQATTIWGDAYDSKTIRTIIRRIQPDLIYINLHGAVRLAEKFNQKLPTCDLLSIVTNRHRRPYERMQFQFLNLLEGRRGRPTYLAKKVK